MSLQRVRWTSGARLLAGDFAAAAARTQRLWQLHVLAAHGTWGVAAGLEVHAGPHAVTVEPGLAYDACGRVVVARERAAVPLPPDLPDGAWELLAGAGRPRWRWSPAGHGRGADVPLARFHVSGGVLGVADLEVRQVARPVPRPRIASGLAEIDAPEEGPARVDTSVGGFERAPAYLAQVVSPVVTSSSALGPLVSISGEARGSFDVQVRIYPPPAVQHPFTLAWTGVELEPKGAT